MPVLCRNVQRRNKLRVFTAKDCGRIVCYALEDGADLAELRKEVQRCLGGQDCDCETVKQFVRNVLTIFAGVALLIGVKSHVGRALRTLIRLALKSPNESERLLARETLKSLDDLTDSAESALNQFERDFELLWKARGDVSDAIIISETPRR